MVNKDSSVLFAGLIALVAMVCPGPAAAQERVTPVVEVVRAISPAVVNIAAEAMVRERDPFFGQFFSRQRRVESLGSGLVIEPNGIVVTNAHVIEGASRIVITTAAGRELEAEVLGSDRDFDLAVLKVSAGDLPSVPLGDRTSLMIGETVVAIGNPFGLSNTVTTGVLSARGRTVPMAGGDRVFTDFLQTDASINPGNSGGPLVNIAGEVIGINTAIISGGTGIGFAIPADRVRRVVSDLMRYGSLQPVWTGLRLISVQPEVAYRFGLASDRGVLVERVYPDSPGEAAGFKPGDLITHLRGLPVAAKEDVTTVLYSVPAGEPLPATVSRRSQTLKLPLRSERPEPDLGLRFLERGVGLVVALRESSVVVEKVVAESAAAAKRLRPGDVILGANGQRVRSLEELAREVLRGLDRGGVLLVAQRGGRAYYLNFEL